MYGISACSRLQQAAKGKTYQATRITAANGQNRNRLTLHAHTYRAASTQPLNNKAGSKFQGRSFLLTGATSGIGHAVLTRLVVEGASYIRLITRDRNRAQQAIERAQAEAAESHSEVEIIEQDLSSPDFSSRKLFVGKETWPAVNTLVHCAGISQSSLAISTTSTARSDILKVNAEAYMQLLADFLKSYHSTFSKSTTRTTTPNPSYCAVGVSSLLAAKGGYGTSTYAASKAAMVAYNRAVSVEAGHITRKLSRDAPAFRVNTVLPGYIDTPMTTGFSSQVKSDLEGQIPLGRFGSAEEVADAVLFLISNEYANNCTLNLDGGLSAI